VVFDFMMYRPMRRLSYADNFLGRPSFGFVVGIPCVLISYTVLFSMQVISVISRIVCLPPSTSAKTWLRFFGLQSCCFFGFISMREWSKLRRFGGGGGRA